MAQRRQPRRIQVLPKEVVDRIAAGEVVQRPASVVKELIENSLDANSSCIDVVCSGGGLRLLSISDDGGGIRPADLNLAAVRFATSKLVAFDDLKSIRTFGFRGEALASTSMVSRLSIISRRRLPDDGGNEGFSAVCAYKQVYRDGKPTASKPTPCAGNMGTLIKVEDLFYNVPSRKRAFEGQRKEVEEYNRVLAVCQRYAIHRGRNGVAFTCRKSGGNTSDLNTQSLSSVKKIMSQTQEQLGGPHNGVNASPDDEDTACKDVISHVFGTAVSRELLTLRCEEGDVDAVSVAALLAGRESTTSFIPPHCVNNDIDEDDVQNSSVDDDQDLPAKSKFAYKALGLITNGSYSPTKSASQFIIFINDRLVECSSLKRSIESVYADTLPKHAKPFVYLSLELPGPHVDVNVHPTKREVAVLHEEKLCTVISAQVKKVLGSVQASRTFYAQALLPGVNVSQETIIKKTTDGRVTKKQMTQERHKKDASNDDSSSDFEDNANHSTKAQDVTPKKAELKMTSTPLSSSNRKPYNPKSLVRTSTAARVGALEPFLVSTQTQEPLLSQRSQTQQLSQNNTVSKSSTNYQQEHAPDCEFASQDSIDLSIPGAFTAICRCQITNPRGPPPPRPPPPRVKKVVNSICHYDSIIALRREVAERAHVTLSSKLRESSYVGTLSRQRSLLQWNTELYMINHYQLSKELFYQLALARFGNFEGQIMNFGKLSVGKILREAEEDGWEQVVSCLSGHKDMLQSYFGIIFTEEPTPRNEVEDNDSPNLYLTGLPILLENHAPSPHGLPLFLLRLATEVEYQDEKMCFEAVCSELGAFYAELPWTFEEDDECDASNETMERLVRHCIFPAISYLLVPPKDFVEDGSVVKLAALESLYKVFERC